MSRDLWIGIAIGLALPIAYHHFVKPLPGAKSS